MGRIFLQHMGGSKVISCKECRAPLSNKANIESSHYQGSSGPAYLFTRATNLRYSEIQDRNMLTGKHYVRDVFCKVCNGKLGWMYEFAVQESQRHKEGKVILEQALIVGSK